MILFFGMGDFEKLLNGKAIKKFHERETKKEIFRVINDELLKVRDDQGKTKSIWKS